jgi:rod shape-determining protein MreC
MTYGTELEGEGGRRQVGVAVGVFVAALVTLYLPDPAQQSVAWALRASLLRPFIATQERLADARLRAQQVEVLRGQLDSLSSVVSTQAALADENRTLRSLLDLSERVGPSYRPASLIRPGTAGSESMFLLFLGEEHGVRAGAPIISRHGLVGVIREVRGRTAVGMDWTHPDFRASGMLEDGTAFGIVENRRGAFPEEDRLVLNGAAYFENIQAGTVVLTSGLGGVFPRGIPIGFIDGVAAVEGRWLKSYWLRPMVEPGAVTHVLVAVEPAEASLAGAWPPDSIVTRSDAIRRELVLEDSVRLLRALLEERFDPPPGEGR